MKGLEGTWAAATVMFFLFVAVVGLAWPASAACLPPDHPATSPQAEAKPAAWQGFRLAAPEHDATLRIGGLVQADGVFTLEDRRWQDDRFELRRVRLSLKGIWGKTFSARIQAQWTSSGVEMLDAHVDLRIVPGLSLRAGKQKTPLGLEMLRPAAALGLPERGLASSLVPSRDIGVALYGEFREGLLTYAAGVYNGVGSGGKSDGNIGDNFDIAGRAFVQPFILTSIRPLRGLGVGLAGSWGMERGQAGETGLGRFRTVARDVFLTFSDGVIADGQRWRVNPQAWWYWGPLGVFGEFIYAARDVRGEDRLRVIEQQAWTVEVAYVLTQEAEGYRGVIPQRRWGALELVGRYSELRTAPRAFNHAMMDPEGPGIVRSWGGALHYWAAVAPLMAEVAFVRTDFMAGAGADRPPENALFTRVQASF